MTVFVGLEAAEEEFARGFAGRMGVDMESVRVKAAGSMDMVKGGGGLVCADLREALRMFQALICGV